MAEHLEIISGTKEERYASLLPQIEAVVKAETDAIANMANVASMLHETFGFWWTGFYRVIDGQLVLGPFQGPMACTRIAKGRGVCGTAWKEARTRSLTWSSSQAILPALQHRRARLSCP